MSILFSLANLHIEALANLLDLPNLKGAPKFITQPKDTIAIQDQPAKFECLVDALPKPKLTWLLNGKELTNKEVKFETDAKTSANFMVIPKVTSANFGNYTIKASNSVGEIECSFNLDVLGKLSSAK